MDAKYLSAKKKEVEKAIKYDFDDVLEHINQLKNNNEKIDYLCVIYLITMNFLNSRLTFGKTTRL